MSAYILSDLHFCTIAQHIARINPNMWQPAELANKLKRVNIESVNFRYSDNQRVNKCKVISRIHEHSDAYVIRLIKCWSYQSCEKQENLEYIILLSFLNSNFTAEQLETNDELNSTVWSI